MTYRYRQRLDDIVAAIDAINSHVQRGPLSDGLVFDAVRIRLIEIGEAVKALPDELLASRSEIPWRRHAHPTHHCRLLTTIHDPENHRLRPVLHQVAMMCAYREPAFDHIMGAPSAWTSDRLPAPDSLAEHYVAASGHDLEHWEFHRALACFKITVIAAGIDHRRRAGSGGGAGFDTAGEAVPHFLELAHQTAIRT